jgi:deazaflavin-dependent oxidoreductase (nitroreductase family)
MRLVNRGVAGRYDPHGPTGSLVLLLTTTGRKSGLPRVTPLQYEEVDGLIYVASVRGQKADWFGNLVANPEVTVELPGGRSQATAEPITDPGRIADFLELRLARRPGMIRGMLLLHGLAGRPDREKLEEVARQLALVVLWPKEEKVSPADE